MKQVYNSLKEPVYNCIKKEFSKDSLKLTSNLVNNVKSLEINDKIDIGMNNLGKNQPLTYKPSLLINSMSTPTNHSLNYVPKSNFSSLIKPHSYFYSNVTGMEKEIDVTSDYVFKGIFSDKERTKNFLESVLIGNNKILPEGSEIQELEYLSNEYIQNKAPEDAKKTIFDLQIKTTKGIFIIEMQKTSSKDYLDRVGFYNSVAHSNQQIKDGKSTMKDYTKALPIVTISVVKDKILDEDVPCVSYHVNMERETKKEYIKASSYVFIELGKFDPSNYDKGKINDNEKDWLSFMKTQELTQTYKNEQVNNAVKYVDNIRTNKYEEYIRYQMSELAAQKELESAEEKGVSIGENKKSIEIARNLISNTNLDDTAISQSTGLSKEQVSKLRK